MSPECDEFGIPVSVDQLQRALFVASDERLESVLGRKLTTTELSAAESMASEHASYGSTRFYLKTLLPVDGPNHFAGIGHEAASVAFFFKNGRSIALSYSSESHNGPSYVCAHPGAGTGTGGNERDNAVETATKPEKLFEARRQGHPRYNTKGDPIKQHTDETTKGIGDYGNAMGIPHGDGSIKYHTGFTGNNLVNVMCISVSDKTGLQRNKVPCGDPNDYVAIYIGKASDTTGIGGTKFASKPIDMEQHDLNEKAVQDPDPHLQEAEVRGIEAVMNEALAEGWADQISWKDMGAAGLLCSTIEQLHAYEKDIEVRADVDDDGNIYVSQNVPADMRFTGKVIGVSYEERAELLSKGKIKPALIGAKKKVSVGIVINGDLIPQNEPRTSIELLEAETQERFMAYVHKDHAPAVLRVFNDEIGLPHINKGACAKIVGRCNSSGRYVFARNGVVDVDAPFEDLAAGPLTFRKVKEREILGQEIPPYPELLEAATNVLGSISFKDDSYVHDHYDKHVRSTNIVNRGEGCATLHTHPLFGDQAAYSAVFDSNPVIGMLDPALQAEDSLIRAAYRMAAVGCSVIGVTNNANYGRTDVPEEMWEFKKGQEGVARACYNWELEQEYIDTIIQDPEIAEKFRADGRRHVTVNSGNCSMNKANANTGTAIPPTTILGIVGWTNRPGNYTTWDMKPIDADVFLVGDRQDALGGTDYLQANHGPEALGDRPFSVDYNRSRREVEAIIKAVRNGYVAATNAVEEGGLMNAVAEMSANADSPVEVEIDARVKMGVDMLDNYQKLFSESYGMVLQVEKDKSHDFLKLCRSFDVNPYRIGSTGQADYGVLRVRTSGNDLLYDQSDLQQSYRTKIDIELEAAA